MTEIEVLESFLHDDLAAFIYERLKRRPMVLPVVVEVLTGYSALRQSSGESSSSASSET